MERHEGGGLSISGVALSAHCHLTLIICGTFCLLAGIVLTYVAYANTGHFPTNSPLYAGNDGSTDLPDITPSIPSLTDKGANQFDLNSNTKNNEINTDNPISEVTPSLKTNKQRQESLGKNNLTVVGPICIATGLIMIFIGMSLFALGRKVRYQYKKYFLHYKTDIKMFMRF